VAPPMIPSSIRSRWLRTALVGACVVVIPLTAVGCKARTVPADSVAPAASVAPSDEAASAPPGKALLTLSGTGDKTSDPFSATGQGVEVTYAYTCATPGGFTLNFYGTNGSPALPDVIIDDFADKGGDTTTESLNGSAGPFHVEIVSGCDWTVEVVGTP